MRSFFAVIAILLMGTVSASAKKELDPENTLYLDLKDGRVVIQMFPAFAPNHVERIKELTRAGFYDDAPFHRVIDGFMAQTGDPDGDGIGGSDLPNLEDEFNIKRHWRGMASMANTGEPGSANSQFFILFNDEPKLDRKYTVWGRVVEGMRHVDNIKRGNPNLDGRVEADPDRIVKLRVAADVDGAAPETVAEAPVSAPATAGTGEVEAAPTTPVEVTPTDVPDAEDAAVQSAE